MSLTLGLSTGMLPVRSLLSDGPAAVREAERLGFDSVWSSETYGADALTPLAWWGAHTERVRLGTSVLQVSARRPAATAMAAMTMDHLCGGRFVLGLGVSGPHVVEGWYGEPFAEPLARTREYVAIVRDVVARRVRSAPAGRTTRCPRAAPTGSPGGAKPLKSNLPPLRGRIPIHLAAQGPRNIALAAEIADGWLPLFYSPYDDAELYGPHLEEGFARRSEPAGNFEVCPSVPFVVHDDVEQAADRLRPMYALYFGGMGSFHREALARMGFEAAAAKIRSLYLDGRKDEAAASVPTKLIERLALIGPPGKIRADLAAWRASRVTSLLIAGPPGLLRQAAELVLG